METAESMAEKLHGFRVYHPDDRTRLRRGGPGARIWGEWSRGNRRSTELRECHTVRVGSRKCKKSCLCRGTKLT